jgi:hypothetical protein
MSDRPAAPEAKNGNVPTVAGHIHLVQFPHGENGKPVSSM